MKRPQQRIPSRQIPRAPNGTFASLLTQAWQFYQAGRFQEAMDLCGKKLLSLAPKNRDVLFLAGTLHYVLGDYQTSEHHLTKAIAAGAAPEAHANLGLTLSKLHRYDEAEQAYRRAVAANPAQPMAWNNLGNILQANPRTEHREEAIHCYKQAIAQKPDYANAYANLGFALDEKKDRVGAEENYRLAISHDPRHLTATLNLASLLDKAKRPQEALKFFRQAIALQPQNPKAIGAALNLRRDIADWEPEGVPQVDTLLTALRQSPTSELPPLYLLALPEADAQVQRLAAQRFAKARWEKQMAQPPLVSLPAAPLSGRMRVGYISADFRNHPIAHLVTDVIIAHDREHVEVFLYSYGPHTEGAERRAFQDAADHFIILNEMDDMEAAERIRDDGIDVLIDLTGYTTHSRSGINALRPAPVIASWIGYVGTLGEPRMADYIIGDAIVTPPESAANFSESLALMPECFQPNRGLTQLPPSPSRADEGLPENAVVFCSFNQIFKLNPQLWDDWCRILQAVPNSVLWLYPASVDLIAQNLRREAEQRGVAADRLIFAKRKSLDEHRARVALADIALDTFPYNSGATASDTLRAGVPLITRMGDTFASRMAGSLLHAIGLPELVTGNREDYVQLSISLAQDASRRLAVRDKFARLLPETALFKPQRFARQLEALFHAMHQQARTGRHAMISLPDKNW